MNVDNKAEMDHTLVQADIHVPDSPPELLGAVGFSQYMLHARRGWHPERGTTAKCGSEETLSRGPFHVFHVAMGVDVKRCHV